MPRRDGGAGARDDTVATGPFTWAIYEYEDAEDPRRAAHLWMEDFAERMRSATGLDIQVARFPDK